MGDERWRTGPVAPGYDPAAEGLAELRELLLGADRQRLRELERRLDAVGLTGEELAELLPEAIALRAGRDRQLARALAPTIEGAISESVRRNPREIATAIFPVLGPAIRKAIAEAFAGLVASINRGIEHSVSPRGLKWRIEAWRTGLPYAQIVLKHALVYRVEQVFLIHAETGLLLAHAAPPDRAVADADLISGMLTAIREFVGDAFGPEREAGGLRTFSVGELTVLVEQGPRALLAAVVRGQAPETLLRKLQGTLESIHLQFTNPLTEFDGETTAFEPAVPLLEDCIETRLSTDRPAGEGRGRAAWLPWAIGVAVLALVVGWLAMRSNREWNRALTRLRSEPGIVLVRAERDWGTWHLSGLRDPLAAEPMALLAAAGVDTGRVVGEWQPYLSLTPRFARVRAEQAALAELERTIEAELVMFRVGSATLDAAGRATAARVAALFQRLDAAAAELGARVTLRLVGRTDPTGSDSANQELSRLRAEGVAALLAARGVDTATLDPRALGTTSPLAVADPAQRSYINRSVSFDVRVGTQSREAAE
ncbi:MAG: OmpA family protein [Gemmatimonadales bacterium]